MLIVNSNELLGYLVHAEFFLVDSGKRIHERLAFFVIGHGGEQLFPRLLDGGGFTILHEIARANEFHKRANIGFLHWINGGCWRRRRVCLGRSRALRRSLDGILRSTLNDKKECTDV